MSVFEIAALVVFLASLAALLLILARKLPRLASLPKTTPVFPAQNEFLRNLRNSATNKIKQLPAFKNFSLEIWLQKILSKTRVLTLRLENKTGHWLEILRKKSQKNNGHAKTDDNFWQELQKNKKQPM